MKCPLLPIAAALLAVAGCTTATSPVLPLGDIAKAELRVRQFPNAAGPQAPCTVTMEAPADLADIHAWLSSMNWSQSGQDMKLIRLPQPDGGVTITQRDGTAISFPFFWDGRIVDEKANRLLSGADVTKLRALALRACK